MRAIVRAVTFGLLGVVPLASIVHAADLPPSYIPPPQAPVVYAPPPPPPVFSWTGFYVGAFGGYDAFTDSDFNGWIVGGEVGYNYQFPNSFVAGIEVDAGYSSIKGSVAGDSFDFTSTPLATARVRAGYAFDRVFVYATGGVAVERFQLTDTFSFCGSGSCTTTSSADTRVGWVAGAGVEWAFVPNVSIKAEYLYGAVESATLAGSTFAGANAVYEARVGLNFLFH